MRAQFQKQSGTPAYYFDPNSAEDLRMALERVATTEGLQADLRARGYARIDALAGTSAPRRQHESIAR